MNQSLLTINDQIHGEFTVDEPLIVELVNSAPFQRLKGVSTDGAHHLIVNFNPVTRYEHSLGVYYLAKHFGGSLELQAASLLHDIGHTAFSHVIDYIFDGAKQNYHDDKVEEYIQNTEIPAILERYGFDWKRILNSDNYPLLKAKMPFQNFDRTDYFLRDALSHSFIEPSILTILIDGMKTLEDKMYFEDRSLATNFALLCLNISQVVYLSPNSNGSYFLLANALKAALQKNIITETDFWSTDAELMSKIESSADPEIRALIGRLDYNTRFVSCAPEEAEFQGPEKFRYINPLVKDVEANTFKFLTEISKDFSAHIDSQPKQIYFNVREVS